MEDQCVGGVGGGQYGNNSGEHVEFRSMLAAHDIHETRVMGMDFTGDWNCLCGSV